MEPQMDYYSIPGFTDPFASWTHLLAALGFLIGSVILYRKGRGNPVRVTALCVYSFSLVFLFSMSGVFHLLDHGSGRDVLQRLDHAGIWILIAGTFTPIHVILFRGIWRGLILSLIWTIAITGMVLEVVFFKSFPESLILSLFLGLGWFGALTGYHFRRTFHGESLQFLLAGGICYSVGALIDFVRWPVPWHGIIGPHDIFHILVVAGAYFHWRFIFDWADHPVANTLQIHVRVFPNNLYIGESIGDQIRVEATSAEALKAELKRVIKEKYHESIIPNVHLRYSQEETITSRELMW